MQQENREGTLLSLEFRKSFQEKVLLIEQTVVLTSRLNKAVQPDD